MNIRIQSNAMRFYPPPDTSNLIVDGVVYMYGATGQSINNVIRLATTGETMESDTEDELRIASKIRHCGAAPTPQGC
ncbi:MAG: hypothetical protein ACYC0Z_16860 [Acidobacteriaceae bacterium]